MNAEPFPGNPKKEFQFARDEADATGTRVISENCKTMQPAGGGTGKRIKGR